MMRTTFEKTYSYLQSIKKVLHLALFFKLYNKKSELLHGHCSVDQNKAVLFCSPLNFASWQH